MSTKEHALYTAVGHFVTRKDEDGNPYPMVLINRREYLLDAQEMTVWTVLNWRLLNFSQLQNHYDILGRQVKLIETRTLENCLSRLETRGLVASGHGKTDYDAIYNLLADLYVIPISENRALRTATFLKMILWDGTPVSQAKALFTRDALNKGEAKVMALARQALLSSAELVKCVDLGVKDLSTNDKIMDALYSDEETTSENIGELMRDSENSAPVIMSIANLYLHRKIIFERL